MSYLRLATLAAIIFSFACDEGDFGPSDGNLRLTTVIDDSSISPGELATITHRLENRGSDTVILRFNDGCQIDSFVRNLGTGSLRQLDGVICTLALSELELPAGGLKTWETKVGAVAAQADVVVLPPGRYGAYAIVADAVYSLQSEAATFEVD
jgi:Intracellular proteinase inhibitor